jgi:hypothetical protein
MAAESRAEFIRQPTLTPQQSIDALTVDDADALLQLRHLTGAASPWTVNPDAAIAHAVPADRGALRRMGVRVVCLFF